LIGNGSLLINFDKSYMLKDIYYPHVGGTNHTLGYPSRFGVWTDGKFSWVSSPEWEKSLHYQDETLVTQVIVINHSLEIKLILNDVVDYLENIYLKKIEVINLSKIDREIRLFINHDFHIMETKLGDTAYYDPRTSSIIHYKKTYYFLISSLNSDSSGIDQYATGIQDSEWAEGTWRDAEDGILSGNPIADGDVDSTIAIHLNMPAENKAIAYYWIAAGRKYREVTALNKMVMDNKPEYFINRTAGYWKAWLNKYQTSDVANCEKQKIVEKDKFLPDNLVTLYKSSLLIVRAQMDNDGAIIAANDLYMQGTDNYSYMWPRDGAMVAYALDEVGYEEPTKRFFQFCADIITSDGYFLHKYNPDHSYGSSWLPWVANGKLQIPIQEDETALVIWSFWHHFQKHQNIEFVKLFYEPLVIKSGDFLLRYRNEDTGLPLPSYDLWEERFGIHTFTTSAVCAGLLAASNFAEIFGESNKASQFRSACEKMKSAMDNYLYNKEYGRFLRTVVPKNNGYEHDLTVDSSMYGTFTFGTYDVHDEKVKNTMQSIQENLTVKTNIGGIARYKGDQFNHVTMDIQNVPGNPWIICNLWMAQYTIAKANTISELLEAVPILQWVARCATESGMLPEQVHPYTGQPTSVSPLTWSHGEFILTIQKFVKKLNSLNNKT